MEDYWVPLPELMVFHLVKFYLKVATAITTESVNVKRKTKTITSEHFPYVDGKESKLYEFPNVLSFIGFWLLCLQR